MPNGSVSMLDSPERTVLATAHPVVEENRGDRQTIYLENDRTITSVAEGVRWDDADQSPT